MRNISTELHIREATCVDINTLSTFKFKTAHKEELPHSKVLKRVADSCVVMVLEFDGVLLAALTGKYVNPLHLRVDNFLVHEMFRLDTEIDSRIYMYMESASHLNAKIERTYNHEERIIFTDEI